MSKELMFWVLMLIWLVFGFAFSPRTVQGIGGNLLLFVLLALLGWAVFGAAIKG